MKKAIILLIILVVASVVGYLALTSKDVVSTRSEEIPFGKFVKVSNADTPHRAR